MRRVVYRTAQGEVITYAHPMVDLLAAGQAARVRIATECVGNAACGRCKVRVVGPAGPPGEADRRHLASAELAAGWRLACQLRPRTPVVVEVPPPNETGLALEVPAELRALPVAAPDAATPPARLLVLDEGGALAAYPLDPGCGRARELQLLASRPAAAEPTVIDGEQRVELAVRGALGDLPPARPCLVLVPGDPTWVVLARGDEPPSGWARQAASTPALAGAFAGGVPLLRGAIDAVTLDGPDGRTVVHTVGEEPATGVSGPGLLSLAAALGPDAALPAPLPLVRANRTASRQPFEIDATALAAWRHTCAAVASAIASLALFTALPVVVCTPPGALLDPAEVQRSGLLPARLALQPPRLVTHAVLRALLSA
jgi:ferredoxin